MLQKLDTEHLNRLALADALASMEPHDFDMRRPDRCICGHAMRLLAKRTPYFGGVLVRSSQFGKASVVLCEETLQCPLIYRLLQNRGVRVFGSQGLGAVSCDKREGNVLGI